MNFIRGQISDLSRKYDLTLISSPGSEWEELKSEFPNVKCVEIPMERHISVFKDLKSLIRLWWFLLREHPDAVHSITPKAGLLGMTASFFAFVPIRIHTFTGLIFPTSSGLKRKILIFTDKLTCLFASHIIPEGEGVKSDLNKYVTKKPMQVLGYGNIKGVDMEKFNRTKELIDESHSLRKPGIFTFIFIGRMVGDKGVNELVEAFVRLTKDFEDIRLLLVGEMETELDPLDKATLKHIEDSLKIEFVGRQKDIRPWLLASDVAILPSYREGFPNVVLEAGAMGLAQIVTDINGSREIIEDGVNGLIIPPADTDALHKAMCELMTNRELLIKMSSNARKMIAERFDEGFVKHCLFDFYDKVIR